MQSETMGRIGLFRRHDIRLGQFYALYLSEGRVGLKVVDSL